MSASADSPRRTVTGRDGSQFLEFSNDSGILARPPRLELGTPGLDIERANRVMREPFDCDQVRVSAYADPSASDDGLFKHKGDYVPCFGCEPCPSTGQRHHLISTW